MYKILLIEDDQDHQELIIDEIKTAYDSPAHIVISSTLYGGLSILTQQKFEIILFDLNLPDSKAKNTIEEIKNLKLNIPVIALTSLDDSDHIRTLLSNGVQDYLTKDKLTPDIIKKSFFYSIERKSFEKKMQKEIEEREIFCYALSHDFRAPIRRIETFSNTFIERKADLDDTDRKSINAITSQCSLLQNLISELERYISLDEDNEAIVDTNLESIIEQIKENNKELFDESSAELTTTQLPTVSGLKSNLYLLFENIVLNAIKHNDKPPKIDISVEAEDDTVIIDIKDNGPGIETFFIKNIFMPFKKKHANTDIVGSGLGLAIAKKIVNQHLGDIKVTSTLGEGSTFSVLFPKNIIINQ